MVGFRPDDGIKRGGYVEGGPLIRSFAKDIIVSGAVIPESGRSGNPRVNQVASDWLMPSVSSVTIVAPAHLTMTMDFMNRGGNYYSGDVSFFNFSRLLKFIRLAGLIAVISYMTVILFTWMYANLGGYVYFSAGEPVLSIKYTEWLLGFIGILVAFDYLHKEMA